MGDVEHPTKAEFDYWAARGIVLPYGPKFIGPLPRRRNKTYGHGDLQPPPPKR